MTIQRCAHLKHDEPARLYHAMGIAMELCDGCRAEMDERLGERPPSGETPIEQAAKAKTGGSIDGDGM
jgi:hypothetical protein